MSVYSPVVNAFGQDTYFDQQGTALAGMLANASDINLVDAAVVDSTVDFAVCGRLYVVKLDEIMQRNGVNHEKVLPLPADGELPDAFHEYCVIVRNQQVQTNADNESGWEAKRMANILRTSRVGGRIWMEGFTAESVMAADAIKFVCDSTNDDAPVGVITTDATVTDATLCGIDGAILLGSTPPDSDGHCLVLVEFHHAITAI